MKLTCDNWRGTELAECSILLLRQLWRWSHVPLLMPSLRPWHGMSCWKWLGRQTFLIRRLAQDHPQRSRTGAYSCETSGCLLVPSTRRTSVTITSLCRNCALLCIHSLLFWAILQSLFIFILLHLDNEGSERKVLEELLKETRINASVRVSSQLMCFITHVPVCWWA